MTKACYIIQIRDLPFPELSVLFSFNCVDDLQISISILLWDAGWWSAAGENRTAGQNFVQIYDQTGEMRRQRSFPEIFAGATAHRICSYACKWERCFRLQSGKTILVSKYHSLALSAFTHSPSDIETHWYFKDLVQPLLSLHLLRVTPGLHASFKAIIDSIRVVRRKQQTCSDRVAGTLWLHYSSREVFGWA